MSSGVAVLVEVDAGVLVGVGVSVSIAGNVAVTVAVGVAVGAEPMVYVSITKPARVIN